MSLKGLARLVRRRLATIVDSTELVKRRHIVDYISLNDSWTLYGAQRRLAKS
jgi:hypothetical protein